MGPICVVNYNKIILSAAVVVILLAGVGTAAGVGNMFTDIQRVSFGDVKYEQSELKIDTVDLIGPGTTVQEIEVTVDMKNADGPTEATIEAWLLADGVEKTSGVSTKEFKPNDSTVIIELESEIRESEFNTVDFRIVEARK